MIAARTSEWPPRRRSNAGFRNKDPKPEGLPAPLERRLLARSAKPAYVALMRATKSLVQWAAAAIVMIAAFVLSPGAALAHPGHGDAATSISISFHQTEHASASVEPEAASQETPAQSAARNAEGDQQAPCPESCCLLAGASCCGAAVACGPPGATIGLASSQRLSPSQDSLPSGLSAQALQEPPRVQL